MLDDVVAQLPHGLKEAVEQLTRGASAVIILLGAFWKGDNLLSEGGRKQMYEALSSTTQSTVRTLAIVDRYFSDNVPTRRFMLNTLIFSCAALLLLLIAYISLIPGMWTSLREDSFQRSEFLAQIVGNGLPVVFVVNYLGFVAYAQIHRPQFGRNISAVAALALDMAIRILLFLVTTAIIYVLFADLAGSFKGDDILALRAVGPTLMDAATFRNLTGVYLYACAISALPIFLAAIIELMQRSPLVSKIVRGIFFFLPFENRPLRSIAVVLGVFSRSLPR
jgi:hypothetical protein